MMHLLPDISNDFQLTRKHFIVLWTSIFLLVDFDLCLMIFHVLYWIGLTTIPAKNLFKNHHLSGLLFPLTCQNVCRDSVQFFSEEKNWWKREKKNLWELCIFPENLVTLRVWEEYYIDTMEIKRIIWTLLSWQENQQWQHWIFRRGFVYLFCFCRK